METKLKKKVIPKYIVRHYSRGVPCPRCNANAGSWCIKIGTTNHYIFNTVHKERIAIYKDSKFHHEDLRRWEQR